MRHRIVILRGIALTLLLLGVSLLGACSNNAKTIKSVPRSIKGSMTFPRVFVSKAPSIRSPDITRKVRVEFQSQMPEATLISTDMYLKIQIQDWVGKTEALKGRTRAEALGVKIKIKALVRVVDPITKGVVAEVVVSADHSPRNLPGELNPLGEAEDRCIEKFTRLLIKRLY